MTKLYIITGFLGTGKTTFLKNFITLFAGKRIALVINEFGREGVDGKLLADREAELSEITGGSVFCTCLLGTFEAELEKILRREIDVIIIETSGLTDPTGIRRLLADNPLYKNIEYSGCLCLADCARFPKVYTTARTCRKQLSAAGVLILNKLDLASPAEKAEALDLIRDQRPDIPVVETSFGKLPDDVSLLLSPPSGDSLNTGMLSADISLHSLVLELDSGLSSSEARKILVMIADDTYRMKGFLLLTDGQFLADCVAGSVELEPFENAAANNHIMVLYGHGLSPRKAIREAMKWYPGRLRLAGDPAAAPEDLNDGSPGPVNGVKTKLILLGGFLGAGKTTLLQDLAKRLGTNGSRVGFITNDQAGGLVDTSFLRYTGQATEEVSGSCFCCNYDGLYHAIQSLSKQGAGYIVAESVGSCADLSATIVQPIKDGVSGRDIDIAPLTILVDAQRLPAILAGETEGLHRSVAYILRKQLEEADYILINKADLLEQHKLSALKAKAGRAFPSAKIYPVSAANGTGIDEWLQALLADGEAGKTILDIDYDMYAEGEAVLGWLNATILLKSKAFTETWKSFLEKLLITISSRLEDKKAAVGHIKGIVTGGGNFAVGNVTGNGKTPRLRGADTVSPEAELILNARAEISPRELEDLARNSLANVCSDSVEYRISVLSCIQPGRPRPSYRYAARV